MKLLRRKKNCPSPRVQDLIAESTAYLLAARNQIDAEIARLKRIERAAWAMPLDDQPAVVSGLEQGLSALKGGQQR